MSLISSLYQFRFIRPMMLFLVLAMFGCQSETTSTQEHFTRAKQNLASGKPRSAVIELKNVLQKEPEHAQARLLLGQTYLTLGDGQGAVKELRRAKSLLPDDAQVSLDLVRAYLQTGDDKQALAVINDNTDTSKKDDFNLLKGEVYLHQQKLDLARDIFSSQYTDNTHSSDAQLGLANIAVAENNIDKAVQLVDTATELAPTNFAAFKRRGELALLQNDPQRALSAFEQALQLANASQRDTILLALAQTLTLQEQYDQAQSRLDSIGAELKVAAQVKYQQALIHYGQKDFEKVEQILTKLVAKNPQHVPSQMILATLKYKQGFIEQAESHARQVLDITPGHPVANKLLATILLKRNETEQAISVLQRIPQDSRDAQSEALLGSAYMANGNAQQATLHYQHAAKLEPTDQEVKTQLALSKAALGNYTAAVAELEAVLKLEPETVQADLMLIQLHNQQKQYDKAIEAGKAVIARHPDNPVAQMALGSAYLAKGELSPARQQFSKALSLQPNYPSAQLGLAEIEVRRKNPDAAIQRLEETLKTSPDNSAILQALAKLSLAKKDDVKAISYLERACKVDKSALEPRLMLSRLYLDKNNITQTKQLFSELQQIAPEHPMVSALSARIESRLGDSQQAEQLLAQLVRQSPDSVEARLDLGIAQMQNQRFSEARVNFEKVRLSNNPQFQPMAIMMLGRLDLIGRQYANAEQRAEELLKKYPEHVSGHILKGDLLFARNNPAIALLHYQKAHQLSASTETVIRLSNAYKAASSPDKALSLLQNWTKDNPEDAIALIALGSAFESAGKTEQAIQQYEQALKLTPNNPVALNNLAWLYHTQSDPRALELAEKAILFSPNNPAILDTVGWIKYKSGDIVSARALLEKAASLAPGNREIAQHLEEVSANKAP